MPTLTTTVVKQVQLAPTVRRRLLNEFRAYGAIKAQMDTLQHALDKHKANIGAIREETGEASLDLEGFKVSIVAPIRHIFSPRKFISAGGDLSLYNNSFEDVPSRSYEKISLPGIKDESRESDR